MSVASNAVPPSVNGWNSAYIDSEYQRFKADPDAVEPSLRAFFAGFELALERGGSGAGGSCPTPFDVSVGNLIEAYRVFGHLAATIDPLNQPRPAAEPISLAAHGLSDADLDRAVTWAGAGLTLRALIARLGEIYCGSIGVEFSYCGTPAEREWFTEKFETATTPLSTEQRLEILNQLTRSETFERWLGKRYTGKKRFSLEGGESLIPMLRFLTDRAGELGSNKIIVGMAHRGRLNVLRNYLGKETERILTEFEDSWSGGLDQGAGDVKYHRGFSGDQITPAGNVHISLLNNPSHLESVNPLVLGRARARQDDANNEGREGQDEVLPLLIHGDAALPAQGVVTECLNMANLDGYTVGGTVHIVINNQVGFTTDTDDARSTMYCTDVAKMINAPVLHVNGDDPEACVRAVRIAAEYRQQFKLDVFVDLCCFRKHGHNEQDEPGYTQPKLYALVRAHPGTRAKYAEQLTAAGVTSAQAAVKLVEAEINMLDQAQVSAQAKPMRPVPPPGGGAWSGFVGTYSFESPRTAIDAKTLARICAAMGHVPEGFTHHEKLKGALEARAKLPLTKKLSHADGEQVALGALLLEGTPIRLSGQDSRRGTFSQRHAVLRDIVTGERYTSLNHIQPGSASQSQARLDVWDSPLSEYSVMGFEYGYSRACPKTLIMWEAQFGDFCNTAQVIIDQYMAASEVKWDRWAGLTLLLPHGYEGQGPEHSSARLERFLQLCADQNMEVVYPSTGAQVFHLLRRQAKRNFRKPLIVMTPKKFLRAETSTTDELLTGSFQHLIGDSHLDAAASMKVIKVVYCSGKVYHELHERRLAAKRTDVALVRVEQLYPFHTALAREIDARYSGSAKRVWAQEETRNAGAYLFISDIFRQELRIELEYIGRAASASPATGSEHTHKDQQEKLLTLAVGPLGGSGATTPSPNGSPSPGKAPQDLGPARPHETKPTVGKPKNPPVQSSKTPAKASR